MGARTSYAPGTFCWADLSSTDAEASRRFLAGLFGWEFQGPIATLRGVPVAAVNQQDMHEAEWNSYVAVESADASAARAEELGATLVEPPFDVAPFGRLSLIRDPAGSPFCVWQAGEHVGAGLVNEPGALCWNHLESTDVETAQRFYAELFGWTWKDGVCLVGERMNGSASPDDGHGGWMPFFAVEDLEQARARVLDLGGQVQSHPQPTGPGHSMMVADPAGGQLYLYAGEMDD